MLTSDEYMAWEESDKKCQTCGKELTLRHKFTSDGTGIYCKDHPVEEKEFDVAGWSQAFEAVGAPGVFNELMSAFGHVQISEELIRKARGGRTDVDPSDPYWRSFPILHSRIEMPDFIYKVHVEELLERIAAGQDLRPGTDAEMLMGFREFSPHNNMHQSADTLYMRLFQRRLPEKAAEILGDDLDYLERNHGQEADQWERTLRRRLSQSWRKLPTQAEVEAEIRGDEGVKKFDVVIHHDEGEVEIEVANQPPTYALEEPANEEAMAPWALSERSFEQVGKVRELLGELDLIENVVEDLALQVLDIRENLPADVQPAAEERVRHTASVNGIAWERIEEWFGCSLVGAVELDAPHRKELTA